jgi:NADPH:quinone reductase
VERPTSSTLSCGEADKQHSHAHLIPLPLQILGWDASGVVESVGDKVTLFKAGDAVYYAGSIARPGSNAELQLVDSRIVGFKPASLDHAGAAAIPLTALTAWESLFDRLRIARDGSAAGKTLLIVNGAGGVGSLAIQLAKLLAPGLKVIATAGKPESFEWVRSLGADEVISHREPFAPQLQKLGYPASNAVEYVYLTHDTAPIWTQIVDIVKPQGHINTIVLTPGAGSTLDVMPLYMKSVTFSAEAMFTRGLFVTPDIEEQHTLLTEVGRLIDAGKIKATAKANLGPISAASITKGHTLLEEGHVIGKLVAAGWA